MLARITNNLIILAFGFLLRDYLTPVTLVIIALGFIQSLFNLKIPKTGRNIFAFAVFALFFMSIKKVSDPEGWLNFLTSFLVLKTFERDNTRDNYITFFGIILVLGVGSLFEKDITYLIFFLISVGVLLRNFYRFLGYKMNFKRMGGVFMLTLPFIGILFFVMPRSMSPIPIGSSANLEGRIGYTPEVNLSNIESLSGNQTPVFQAMVSKALPRNNLYWRGNVLSVTDGWNWPLTGEILSRDIRNEAKALENEISQKIRLHNYQDNFFGLDFPRAFSFGGQSVILGEERSLRQQKNYWRNSYEVISDQRQVLSSDTDKRNYLRLPLTREIKAEIHARFKSDNFSELSKEIQNHFLQERFSYSLSPGKIQGLQEFFDKKTGFCSHYSSAVAIIFRAKGIPTRLVSGFLGGQYNEFGDYYLVTQNDAHVWLEALNEGRWQRIDPTEWIAPDRVNLSGGDFIAARENPGMMGDFLRSSSRFRVINQWFEQWNFAFYQWIDEVDYFSQLAFLNKLNLKRGVLFGLTLGAVILFTVLYTVLFARKRRQSLKGIEKLWSDFFTRTKTKSHSIDELRLKFETENNELAQSVLNELVLISFNDQKISKKLKRDIRRL